MICFLATERVMSIAVMFDQFIHRRVVGKMPLLVRFLISVAGGAVTVVSLIDLALLEPATVGDNLRAFFGLWLGPVTIFGAIVGLWLHSLNLAPSDQQTKGPA